MTPSRRLRPWLLTLCDIGPAAASRQTDWLAGVLSARGIPTLCLEAHLRLLHDALQAPDVAPVAGADLLASQALRLEERRCAMLAGHRFEPLAGPTPLGPTAGELLLSAVADQSAGVADGADEMRAWAGSEPRLDASASSRIVAFLDAALEVVRS